MATGIVSLAARQHSAGGLASALSVVAVLSYLLIAAASARARALGRPPLGAPDLGSTFLLFSLVAATEMLASEPLVRDVDGLDLGLWILGLAAFALLAAQIARLARAPIGELVLGARGSWLLAAVAAESLVIVAAELRRRPLAHPPLALALALWALGIAVYLAIVLLIAARAGRRGLSAEEITPDYWVVMGAMAIAALAATELTVDARAGLHGAMRALAIAAWAVATCWLPLVAAADAVRVRRRGPSYEDERWAMVFPLGMYSVATDGLGTRLGVHHLAGLSTAFFVIALIAWGAVAAGALAPALTGLPSRRPLRRASRSSPPR
jgi:tellurite resistance protein TehA-like permease